MNLNIKKALAKGAKELNAVGTLVCQSCGATIEHFEAEKVTTLYSQCESCTHEKKYQ